MHILYKMAAAYFDEREDDIIKRLKKSLPSLSIEQEQQLHLKLAEAYLVGLEAGGMDIVELAAATLDKVQITLAELKDELNGEQLEVWFGDSPVCFTTAADDLETDWEEALNIPITRIKRTKSGIIRINLQRED